MKIHYDASHRWTVLGIGFAANCSFAAAIAGIPTTAVFLRSGYHIDNHALGFVLGMIGLGIAVSELPWGMLTDRWGDRRVLLLGLAATTAALAAMAAFAVPHGAHVPGVAALALWLLAIGMLGGSVNGSSGRAVMGWFKEGERGLAMSIRQTAVPAGGGIGALLLPALAAHSGFAAVYGALALMCGASGVFAWRWLHEPPDAAQHTHAAVATTKGPLSDAQIWRLGAGMGSLCAPQAAVLTFGAVFLHDVAHAGVVAISAAMAAVQTGAMIARVASGHWTDRRGNRRVYMRWCAIVTVSLFAALALAASFIGTLPAMALPASFILMIAGGISASAWHGVAFTELATLAGVQRAGTALALGNTFVFMTMFVTPLAIPWLLTADTWRAVWIACALCALIAWRMFPAIAQPAAANVTLSKSEPAMKT